MKNTGRNYSPFNNHKADDGRYASGLITSIGNQPGIAKLQKELIKRRKAK